MRVPDVDYRTWSNAVFVILCCTLHFDNQSINVMKTLNQSGEPMRGSGVSVNRLGESSEKMETELAAYRNKVEQMTVLLKHYQNELESHKVRRDGVETVSRLLAEARHENAILKRNQIALDTTVRNLQNRLTVNGVPCDSATEDNEVIVPGTSKQTLGSLAMENKRLRSMLQVQNEGGSQGGENSESLQRPSVVDTEEIEQQLNMEKLEAENKSMKMKLSDLESLFKSSNNEKDRQLVEFKDEIQRLRQRTAGDSAAPSADHQAPIRNLPGLREQLRSFLSQCQDFESQLEQVELEDPAEAARQESSIELKPVTKQAMERTDSVDGVDVKQLLEEKQQLQDTVEDVTKMNQRWQEFFNERDRHTQSLEQKVSDLEERLKEAMRSGATHETNRRIQQVLDKSQKEVAQMEESKRQAEEEADQLRREVGVRDAQISQLQSQVVILSRTTQQPAPQETSGTIEHLKAQIQVCTEDFEKERQDRQVALQKVASLQEQMVRLNKLNTHLQTMVCNQTAPTPRPPAQEHAQYGHQDPNTLQPRGCHYAAMSRSHSQQLDPDCPRSPLSQESRPGGGDFPDFNGRWEQQAGAGTTPALGPASMPGSLPAELVARGTLAPRPKMSMSDSALGSGGGGGEDSSNSKQENFLTCPKCNKEFSEARQGELLAHMDMCWE